jgi:hypothetical protein
MRVNLPVTIHTVTPICDTCGATLPDVPVEIACAWLAAHRTPALAAVETSLGRWERQ